MKLSVIIPTIGRETLQRAKDSCAGADEIIVIPDSTGDHGYTPRTEGIRRATGTHLAFLDDDDVYLPGAIELFRQAACERPVIFRMDHYDHGILWRKPELAFGNVSTQMFLVPNVPEQLGVWEAHDPSFAEPGGDFTFIKGCAAKMGEPIWRKEIVAKLRPEAPCISIVTPWLEHRDLWPDYFRAVSMRSARDDLLVVDNASQGPLEFAAIRLEENRGFAGGSNAGLRAAQTDAVLFLNNDVSMKHPTWLAKIRAAIEPGVLVGARLRYDTHGSVDGASLPYLDGWCLAGMCEELLELGGFDESFNEPAYYSDNDLCLRARAAGMTLREVRSGILHKTGQTTGRQAHAEVIEGNYARFAERARELTATAA